MNHRSNPVTALMFVVLLVAGSVNSIGQEVIFDNAVNGAAGINDALQSDADPLPENNNMVEIAADDFVIDVDAEVTSVEWTGVYALSNTPGIDDFVIRIYEDDDGPTGEPIAVFEVGVQVNRTDSGLDFAAAFDIYEYSAEISFEAAAETTYWLSIDAQTFADPDDTWFWGSLFEGGNSQLSEDLGTTWSAFGHATDMVLFGFLADLVLGDVNCDGVVDLLDVTPFVELITTGGFSDKADINQDGAVDLLDVGPFVKLITG